MSDVIAGFTVALSRRSRATLPCFALACLGLAMAAPAGADPSSVEIAKIIHGGAGCPGTSQVTASLRSPKEILWHHPLFAAQGESLASRRRQCRTVIELRHPEGWQFALSEVRYESRMKLSPGQKGVVEVEAYFQGQAQTTQVNSTYEGPAQQQKKETQSMTPLWSPCGPRRALSLSLSLLLKEGSESGRLDVLSPTDLGLRWRQCQASRAKEEQ